MTNPLDASITKTLLARSADLLQRGWDDPNAVGPGSPLLAECEQHLAGVRSYVTPTTSSPGGREDFIDALRLAWFATWLARDYSVEGWVRRLDERQRTFFFQIGGGDHKDAQRTWTHLHAPMFDRNGKPNSREKSALPHDINKPTHRRYIEGAQVSSPEILRQVLQEQNIELRWGYVGERGATGVGTNWVLEDCLCENLSKQLENGRRRFNTLKNTIVLEDADLTTTDSLKLSGSRIEGKLRLQADTLTKLELPGSIEQLNEAVIQVERVTGDVTLEQAKGLQSIDCRVKNTSGSFTATAVENFDLKLRAGPTIVEGDLKLAGGFRTIEIASLSLHGDAKFAKVRVGGSFILREATFLKNADFSGLDVSGQLLVETAIWRGSLVVMRARFGDAVAIKFRNVSWNEANFSGSEFGPNTEFAVNQVEHTTFGDDVGAASFKRGVVFRSVENLPVGPMIFSQVEFDGDVRFEKVEFSGSTMFERTGFRSPPDFFSTKWHHDTSFRGAKFGWKDGISKNLIARALLARLSRFISFIGLKSPSFLSKFYNQTQAENELLGRVERRFGRMRELAKEIQSQSLDTRFHREELRARRLRILDPSVKRSEAWFGLWYALLSDYGQQFIRPLLLLLAVVGVSAVAYAGSKWSEPSNIRHSAEIAATTLIRPFYAFDVGLERAAEARAEVCASGQQTTFCYTVNLLRADADRFKLVSAIQSVLCLMLAFLFFLGLRRQFQFS